MTNTRSSCPVGWGCRIHRLQLCRGVRPPPKECPRYDAKQYDGEAPVMCSAFPKTPTSSLALLPGPLCPGMIAPDRALTMG